MDISPEEYRLFSEKTYDPKNADAYEAAKAALEERKQENGIMPLPVEFYSVSQTVNRKYQIEALCADGRVAAVKSGMWQVYPKLKRLLWRYSKSEGDLRESSSYTRKCFGTRADLCIGKILNSLPMLTT